MDLRISICELFPWLNIERVEPLGSAGGFSGGQLWKLVAHSESQTAQYCLRCWPDEHPSDAQLAWIYRVIKHANAQGCHFLAVPIENSRGQTISRIGIDDGPNTARARWELSPWMPGSANFSDDPNPVRLRNMVQALAKFHLASAQITLDFHSSQNLQRRVEQLQVLVHSNELHRLKIAGTSEALRNLPMLNRELNDLSLLFAKHGREWVQQLLARIGAETSIPGNTLSPDIILPVQPILRDVWHDHVLFTGEEVTGLIDYGAMQIDNVAFDLARLLGTTVGDDQASWKSGIAAYEELRRLSSVERKLIPWLDLCNLVLGSLNWLRWLLIEKRSFANWGGVTKRIEFLKRRLQSTAAASMM
jgi:homoserine kinase type II